MNTQTFSLAGTWRARSSDGAFDLSVPVPGSLMHALEEAGNFGPEGLFFRENNRAAEEVARRDFLFSKEFDLPASFLEDSGSSPRIYLEADGLDTLATIVLNGRELARTVNMHRRYRFDVGSRLSAGTNRLEILFADTPAYIEAKQRERKLWHSYYEMPRYAMQGFNRIRKSHCSFGWDWGPIVPDVGVWRDLRLVRYEGGRLGTPLVRQEHREGRVRLDLSVPVVSWDGRARRVEFVLLDPDGRPAGSVRSDVRDGAAAAQLELAQPRLWWPAGLGDQNLYTLTTRLLDGTDAAAEEKTLTIGLRALTVRREADQWGESFAFEANGIPFFARGADWIPEDTYLTRGDGDRLERLIEDARRANFNCLRVWGGGVYPSDRFYELCDRAGLVVWQDLMFACATYEAGDEEFLAEILAEVEDNLERLRHHPSLGLICGNNEMEWGFVDWNFNPTGKMKTEYLLQYQIEFPRLAARVAPDSYYWPASPSSGGDFEAPNGPDRGDTHYWEVWHGNKDFKEYEKHYFRFMSEFGFESFPSMKTIESFTLPEDRNIFSPVMEDHQRCVGGNQKIFAYLAKYYRFPRDFSAVVYLSQLSQAEAIRHGVEHWRRNRGRCMGAVYWQYNDNWPVASWSSVDYYGRWKALHYRARSCFANLLLSCPVEGTRVELHLSNEGRRPASGRIEWTLADLSGAALRSGSVPAAAQALSSVKAAELDFAELLGSLVAGGSGSGLLQGGSPVVPARNRLLFYRFIPDASIEEDGGLSSCVSFLPFKELELRRPALRLAAERDAAGRTVLSVSSDVPALFVELEGVDRDLQFSDNYFHLDGRTERRVVVERGTLAPEEAASALRLRSLRDSYE